MADSDETDALLKPGHPSDGVADMEEEGFEGSVRAAKLRGRDIPLLQLVHQVCRSRGKLAIGAAILICGCAAVTLKSSLSACTPIGSASIISLVESGGDDLLHLPTNHTDAIGQWLADAEDAAGKVPASPDTHKEAAEATERALGSGDKGKSEDAVKTAMARAAKKWQGKRRALKKHLARNSTAQPKRTLALPVPKLPLPSAGGKRIVEAVKTSVASCFFDVTQATSQIAALAANIKDASSTCKHVDSSGKNPQSWASQTCAINVESIFYSAASIAATLSMAANNCAESFEPNLDALCSGSIALMIQSVSQLAVASQLVAASCGPHARTALIEGITPSNIGTWSRRLGEENSTSHAEGRRLLFGGGRGSTATFCAVDISSALWYLAEAGLAINAAANKDAGKSCPPTGNFMDRRRSKAFCAADVAGAIYGFLQAIYFIFFSVVHCADDINTAALCGAGVDGIMSSLAGVAYSGTSIWLACESLQQQWPPPGAGSPFTKKMLRSNVLGNSGQAGRRLAEASEAGIRQFKEEFASPEEAFKSLGFDIADQNADFRKARPEMPLPQDVLELLEVEPAGGSDANRQEKGLSGDQQCA